VVGLVALGFAGLGLVAFGVGAVALGVGAVALGVGEAAVGVGAVAFGFGVVALGLIGVGFGGIGSVASGSGVGAAVSGRAARFSLRRCGREWGRDPRTESGDFSLIGSMIALTLSHVAERTNYPHPPRVQYFQQAAIWRLEASV
jgi:hypothetical protein